MDAQIAAVVRQMTARIARQDAILNVVTTLQPASWKSEYLDSIQGRRLAYNLVGTQTFTISQDGVRAAPINLLVSQDGPFVMTAYPVCMWRPSTPTNATNFGFWRPVYMWPLPTEQLAAVGTSQDIISISYEMTDSGSQRNIQNLPAPPLLSSPGKLLPLPSPTLYTPNTTIGFIPTYEDITFGAPVTPTTGGTLVVALPGYRIVSM